MKRSKKLSFEQTVISAYDEQGFDKDNVGWIEDNFGIALYSNQIENVEDLFDLSIKGYCIVASRGAGKTWGISAGLAAFCMRFRGLRVIVVGPKAGQASRIIREITTLLQDPVCKVANKIDWDSTGVNRMQFNNGSYIVALSGQEGANVEGEHGHILVIDEAHKVPTYSVNNKLIPMVGSLKFSKIIKIGVTMGRNHFFKSCMADNAIVNSCDWKQAEIFLSDGKDTIFYKGVEYPRDLISRMPLPYKEKYFPDRPDLQEVTGFEISVVDWETQYELEWSDDLMNFLSDDDQERLFSGGHALMIGGMPGESYFAGLDTAQGSLHGHTDTDETVLSIWRLIKFQDGTSKVEKVATYIWRGEPLTQKQEIYEIINTEDGLFKCKMTLVDYSNIGIDIVNDFRALKLPIIGKHFGGTEKESKKNWKNALYNYYQVQLQLNRVKYPDQETLEASKIEVTGDMATQVKNALRGIWEWSTLQREKGRGLNDIIEAPEDTVEEEGGGTKGRAYDDVCTSDILGVWAADKFKALQIEMSTVGDLSGYAIPFGVVGPAAKASQGMGGAAAKPAAATNPIAQAQARSAQTGAQPSASPGSNVSSSYLGDLLDGAIKLHRD